MTDTFTDSRAAPVRGVGGRAAGLAAAGPVLALVFLAALGMRAADWWGQRQDNPFFSAPIMDEGMHDAWAQRIASGEGLGPKPFFRAPLYYYLLAGVYALCGPNIALARALGGLLGAVTCVLIARLGMLLGGAVVGLLAGLLAAVYWPLVYFDNQLLTVGLEVFLDVLMLLVLLIGVQRGKLWLFLLASVVWGLSALTRPNVLVLAPGLLIWIWIGRRLGARPLRAVPAGLVLLAGAAVVILPVTLRNRIIGGEWVLIATNGGVNFYIGNNPQADGEAAIVPGTRRDWQGGYQDTHRIPELELGRRLTEVQVSDYWYRQALAWIGAEPGAWLHLTFHKLRLFWSPLEVPNNQPIWFFARLSPASGLYWIGFPVVACLGLAGLCLLGREWRRWLLLVLFLVLYMATVVAFFCPGRYRLPVVPVLILLAANGLARLPQLWRTRALARLGTYGGVGCLAALFIATNPPPRAAFEQANEGMAHFNLGLHYAQQATHDPSELPQACAHLEEAVRLRPYHAMARLWLGLCLLDLSRIDEADAQFAAALQAGGDEPAVHTFYGATLRSRGWLAEAAEQYRIALDLQPAEVEAYVELGEVLLELKRPDEAAGAFRGALQRDPDNPAARKGLREAQAGERSP